MIRKQDLAWEEGDRAFTLNGWRFVTVHGGGGHGDWVPGENCLLFYKTRALVEQYLAFLNDQAEPPRTDHVLELGLYDGGSVPFWFEVLQPKKHVGIDIRNGESTPYLEKYLGQERRRDRIEMHWGISQDDARRLPALVEASLGGCIDLVIDDASHFYEETRASFEILFPRVRPGGFYVIEDWAWGHWRGLEKNFAGLKPLTQLIFDLVEALGSTSHLLMHHVYLCSGFAAIQRGWDPAEGLLADFSLDRAIYRHPR